MYGMDLIRAYRGLISWLAPRLGLGQPAISNWDVIPAERVPQIEEITGFPRHLLRPDLWQPPWPTEPQLLGSRKKIKKSDISQPAA